MLVTPGPPATLLLPLLAIKHKPCQRAGETKNEEAFDEMRVDVIDEVFATLE